MDGACGRAAKVGRGGRGALAGRDGRGVWTGCMDGVHWSDGVDGVCGRGVWTGTTGRIGVDWTGTGRVWTGDGGKRNTVGAEDDQGGHVETGTGRKQVGPRGVDRTSSGPHPPVDTSGPWGVKDSRSSPYWTRDPSVPTRRTTSGTTVSSRTDTPPGPPDASVDTSEGRVRREKENGKRDSWTRRTGRRTARRKPLRRHRKVRCKNIFDEYQRTVCPVRGRVRGFVTLGHRLECLRDAPTTAGGWRTQGGNTGTPYLKGWVTEGLRDIRRGNLKGSQGVPECRVTTLGTLLEEQRNTP